jgi:hypothetical protein
VVTINDVRELAMTLPRSYEALVRDRVKFRVGRLVYLAFSRDEHIMGFAFPKEERDDLITSEPEKFLLPGKSDLRYNWVHARLPVLGPEEMRELVVDAWTMVVPKSVASSYLLGTAGRADITRSPHLELISDEAEQSVSGRSGFSAPRRYHSPWAVDTRRH